MFTVAKIDAGHWKFPYHATTLPRLLSFYLHCSATGPRTRATVSRRSTVALPHADNQMFTSAAPLRGASRPQRSDKHKRHRSPSNHWHVTDGSLHAGLPRIRTHDAFTRWVVAAAALAKHWAPLPATSGWPTTPNKRSDKAIVEAELIAQCRSWTCKSSAVLWHESDRGSVIVNRGYREPKSVTWWDGHFICLSDWRFFCDLPNAREDSRLWFGQLLVDTISQGGTHQVSEGLAPKFHGHPEKVVRFRYRRPNDATCSCFR